MTENEARDTMQATIFAAVLTGIGVTTKATQMQWQGLSFDPPNTSPWISTHINHDGANQLSFGKEGGVGLGTRKYRRTGGITVQCFVPAKDGAMDDVVNLAREVKNLFEGNTISGIRFSNVTVREAPVREAEWLQANFDGDFEYDEQK